MLGLGLCRGLSMSLFLIYLAIGLISAILMVINYLHDVYGNERDMNNVDFALVGVVGIFLFIVNIIIPLYLLDLLLNSRGTRRK